MGRRPKPRQGVTPLDPLRNRPKAGGFELVRGSTPQAELELTPPFLMRDMDITHGLEVLV